MRLPWQAAARGAGSPPPICASVDRRADCFLPVAHGHRSTNRGIKGKISRKDVRYLTIFRRIGGGDRVYANGAVHTNTAKGFFGNLKRGIAGNYHAVSRKWLQGYVNEYVWRYNHGRDGRALPTSRQGRASAC
jgi:hypothetical protein